MTTYEFVETFLLAKTEKEDLIIDKEAISKTAELISGSLVYPLYGNLWASYFDTEAITKHLETLYDDDNHHGIIYFIVILANAVDYELPQLFYIMGSLDTHTHIRELSDAIISDWLDCDVSSE